MKRLAIPVILVLLALLAVVACAPAASVGDKPSATAKSSPGDKVSSADWDKVVEAAKKEGTVAAYGSILSAEANDAVSKSFKDKYGITLDWLVGTADESRVRIETEVATGAHVADLMISGEGGSVELDRNGLGQSLNVPEAEKTGIWRWNPYYFDWNGQKTVIGLWRYLDPGAVINTNLVPEGLASWNDVLNPKWQGKLVMRDPRGSGPGNKGLAILAKVAIPKGELKSDFIEQLATQKVMFIRSGGQDAEWVSQGKAAIGLFSDVTRVETLKAGGAPMKLVYFKEGTILTGRTAFFIKGAPHPNAARLLINWLLTQEGQELMSKNTKNISLRQDVPQTWVPEEAHFAEGRNLWGDTRESVEWKDASYAQFKKVFGEN